MIKSISIENLKSIEEMTMSCKNMNVLVGTNSSGKSTVIQALLVMTQNAEKKVGLNGTLVSFGDFRDAVCAYSKSKKIKLEVTGDSISTCSMEFSDDSSTFQNCLQLKDLLDYENGKLKYLSCQRVGAEDLYWKNRENDENIGSEGEFTMYYILKHMSDELSESLIKTHDSYTFLAQLNYWLSYIVGAEISVQDIPGTERVQASYTVGELRELRPKNVGEGISYLISVLVACLSAREGDIIVIENPEIHLHPLAQARVCEFLYFIANSGRQIFIETHSDHIFNGFRVGIVNGSMSEQKINISFMSLSQDHKTQMTQVKIGRRGRIENPQRDLFDQFDLDLNKMLGL